MSGGHSACAGILKLFMHHGSPMARLAHGISWIAAGAFASRPLLLAGSMVCARLLDPGAYGKLALLQSAVLTLGAFAGMGMATAVTRHLSELRHRDAARASRLLWLTLMLSVGSSVATAVLLVLFRDTVAAEWLRAADVASLLPVTAVTLVFTVVSAAQSAALMGLEAYRGLAGCNFANGVLTAAMMTVGAASGGLAGALWGSALAGLATVLLLGWVLEREARRAGLSVVAAPAREDLSSVLEASVPLLIAGLIPPAISTISGGMLSRTTAGYAELGVFSAADQWRVAILFLGRLLAQPSLPILTDLYTARDWAGFRRMFGVNLLTAAPACAGAAVVLAVFGGRIMALYGKAYAAHGEVLGYCCAGAALAAISWVASQALTSAGEYWLGVRLNVLWAVIVLVLCYWWRDAGALGLAQAFFAAYLWHLVVTGIAVFRLVWVR